MEEIKVSVIVPIYNVEKYIKKSLESIINQTLKEIEIICVNDGTLDSSRDIAQEYADKDSRIKIINKENGGLSSARNAGMEIAKGEYIGFVDSDDWIEPTMYEKLYRKAKETDSEMVICGVHKYDDKTKQIVDDDPYYTLEYFNEKFTENTFNHYDTKDFMLHVCVMAWNKIYKRDFIEERKAKFPDGLIFEDGPFFFSLYFNMQRVSLVREFLYFYRVNRPNSIIDQGGSNYVDIIPVTEMLYNKMSKVSYFNEIKNYFFKEKFNDAMYRYKVMDKKYKKQFYEKMKEFYSKIELENFDGEYPYSAYLLECLKEYDYKGFCKNALLTKIKDKIMSILYLKEGYYAFRIYGRTLKIKKFPNIFDIWYDNQLLYFSFFHKKTFSIKFPYRSFKPGDK